jgi:hypothetical protein
MKYSRNYNLGEQTHFSNLENEAHTKDGARLQRMQSVQEIRGGWVYKTRHPNPINP